jgi:hypothetical protein
MSATAVPTTVPVSADHCIAQFSVSGLLNYRQSCIVTRKQLAIVKHCNVKLDSLCSCDGCELCQAGSVCIKFVTSMSLA